MSSYLVIGCLAVILSASMTVELNAAGFPRWPVRNGDFSTSQGWGRPTDWNPATNSGKHNFKMDPPSPFVNQPSAAVIETVEAGSAYYFQYLSLLEGNYRLALEVSGTPGAKAQAGFSSGAVRATTDPIGLGTVWEPVGLDVSVPGGESAISLLSIAPAGAIVKFRNVKLEMGRLNSSPVPFETGSQLGGLVLPDNPSLAEQYACYELQRCIFKMTGLIPGLKGRDKVYDGRLIYLGRAAAPSQLKKLKRLPDDSYVVGSQRDAITLAGKTDQGTLYAVYDFLDHQGCRWTLPGPLGEVIPKRKELVDCKSKVESPDYDCRGIMVLAQDFFPGGGEEFGWISINMDDYFDWFLRNRLNAIWFGDAQTHDLGEHRGHGWIQLLNHSYGGLIAPHEKYFEGHPDWYALVDGKRMPVCDLGPKFVNQLCVSNKGLRDYTVDLVLDYFKSNPNARAFPLNPMDGPSFWCECQACKKLDPPGLDWSKHRSHAEISGMADRALNYANEVAARVAKAFPDKLIEMYAYGYTRDPPAREKVHRNVFIKYANTSGGPLGRSLLDPQARMWQEWRRHMDGWKKAGATLAFYNYLEWEHPDVALFWFYNSADLLKTLNRRYNCRMLCGETENNILISTMLYSVIARTLWDVDTDYRLVIRDLCDKFYGPGAREMYEYNMLMDNAIRNSVEWQDKDWHPNQHLDLSLEVLERCRTMLEGVAEKVKGDRTLAQRIAYARFGHAYLTYIRALNEKHKSIETESVARQAFDRANSLRTEFGIMTKLPSVRQLKTFYYPPVVDEASTVMELPAIWDFRTDPSDIGLKEKWFERDISAAWVKISTTEAWTSQPPGRGYHGTAWYHTTFNLPADMKRGSRLSLYFGAVDGYAQVFLDGVRIGEQTAAPDVMWDKPFSVPLPADTDPTRPHQLVVRVRKENFAAGIWKTVRIVRG